VKSPRLYALLVPNERRTVPSLRRFMRDGNAQLSDFWGEMAPCDHFMQVYADDDVLLTSLERFAAGGLRAGDGVVVIATPAHRSLLEGRLLAQGLDLAAARLSEQYVDLDAEETLATFMTAGWPDDERFGKAVSGILARARLAHRRVRAFGEMVAVLWANGHAGATVRLEYLWKRFCDRDGLSLFCAYPKSGFTEDARVSMEEICAVHSKVIHH
jgi:hypothetical protein